MWDFLFGDLGLFPTSFVGNPSTKALRHYVLPDRNVQLVTELWEQKGLIGHYGNSAEAEPAIYSKLGPRDEGNIDASQVEVVHHLMKRGSTNRITSHDLLDFSHACFAGSNMCSSKYKVDHSLHPGVVFEKPVTSRRIHVHLEDVTPGRVPVVFWDQHFRLPNPGKSLPATTAPLSSADPRTKKFRSLCPSPDGPHLYEMTIESEDAMIGKVPQLAERIQILTKEAMDACYCRPFEQGCTVDTYLPPMRSLKHFREIPVRMPYLPTGPVHSRNGEVLDTERILVTPHKRQTSSLESNRGTPLDERVDGGPISRRGKIPFADNVSKM